MTVREILTREYVGVSESDRVADAVDLMLEEGAASVVVLRGSEPVGTLTATDALELVSAGSDPGDGTVGEVMSGTLPSVPPDATVAEAAGAMADTGVGSLLVRDGEEVLGVVAQRDVVRATATLAEPAAVGEPSAPAGSEPVAAAVEGGDADPEGAGEYSTQSVCEVCGSLTADLRNFNGQLICADCRDI